MYVLGISGSPRIGGNTEILLDKALEGAKSKDARTEKIILNNLKMVPCQECEKMPDDGTCKIEDDFQTVFEKTKQADALILASPIFFGSLAAQAKIMIDRWQCYWRYKYLARPQSIVNSPQRAGGMILVEASKREDFFANAKSIAKNFFATAGFLYKEEIFCPGLEKKRAVLKHKDYLQNAFELGRKLV